MAAMQAIKLALSEDLVGGGRIGGGGGGSGRVRGS